MKKPADWWQKHFGAIGLSTSYPIPVPPNFSCSAQLSLSGLNFERKKEGRLSKPSVTVHNDVSTNATESRQISSLDSEPFPSPKIAATATAITYT